MTWSKEKPTKPGLYWYKMAMATNAFCVEVDFSQRKGEETRLQAFFHDGSASYLDFMNGGDWQRAEPRP